jgi:hypothetical protein
VDRHENIGRGKIKAEAFARILQHPKLGAGATSGMPGAPFLNNEERAMTARMSPGFGN